MKGKGASTCLQTQCCPLHSSGLWQLLGLQEGIAALCSEAASWRLPYLPYGRPGHCGGTRTGVCGECQLVQGPCVVHDHVGDAFLALISGMLQLLGLCPPACTCTCMYVGGCTLSTFLALILHHSPHPPPLTPSSTTHPILCLSPHPPHPLPLTPSFTTHPIPSGSVCLIAKVVTCMYMYSTYSTISFFAGSSD